MQVTELHLHDHYSALDGTNTPEEYMKRAKELGMTHLAQTNHGTLSGHRDFQRAAAAAGIVPILGVEGYISSTDRFDKRSKANRDDGTNVFNHVVLLAQNENGLKNLNAINAESWKSGFYNKPRCDFELLEEFNEDIIVLSGCLNGLLAKALEVNDYDKALEFAKKYQRIFGDRFFIEVQGHNPKNINAGLMRIADEIKAMPVVTSDCHYARKEDLWAQEAILILSTKPKFRKGIDLSYSQTLDVLDRFNYLYPERKMTFQDIQIYLRSAEEHMADLEKHGIDEAPVANTMVVANMIGDYPYYEGLSTLPSPDKSIKDLDAELRRLVFEGLKWRGVDENDEYVNRANEELETISNVGMSSYFLILADVVEFARSRKIMVGPGRGSGVASLVNYSLGITNIDPMKYGLLFFRFLTPPSISGFEPTF